MLPFNNPHGMPRPPIFGRPNVMPYGNPLMMPPMNVMVGAPGLPPFMQHQAPMPGGMTMGPYGPAMPGFPPSMPHPDHYHPAPQHRPMLIGPGVVTSSTERPTSQESPTDKDNGSTSSPATDDWTEHTSADGRKYYYNRVKKVSSWTKPDCLKTLQEKEKGVWREYKTAEGRPYFYNASTKETTWSRPSAMGGGAGGAAEEERRGDSQHGQIADSSELERAMAATMKKLEAEATTQARQDGSASGGDGKPSSENQELEMKQRQAERFRELLKDKYTDGRITTAMSWEQACRLIQHDQRFKALPKISEKKQTFNAWKIQRAKEEKDEKRLAIKKSKEDLEKWLMANPKMTTTMSYGKATSVFEQDMSWKAVNEIERREIFRDVQSALKKKQDTAAVLLRERNKKALADILDSIEEVNHRTTWAQAQRILIENESFSMDNTLQGMDKEDALIIFQQNIRAAEKQYDEERVLDTKRNRRQERKIREAFVHFLKELHTRGTINSVSTWSSLYPIISSDERFEAMLTQPGSTALDLFKFFVEELKNQYYEDRKRIKDILKEKGLEVTATTRLDQMQEWVKSDGERGRDVDAGNLKLCWTSLVDKAQAKEKELEREQSRKLKRQETAFHSLIRNAQPPVDPTSKWEDARDSICHMDGFEAVESEEKRLEFFTKYIKAISEACGHHHGSSKRRRKDKKRRKRDEQNNYESAASHMKPKRSEARETEGKEGEAPDSSGGAGSKHKKAKKRHRDEKDDEGEGATKRKPKKHRRQEEGELEEGEAEDD